MTESFEKKGNNKSELKTLNHVDFDITIDGTVVKVTDPTITIYEVAKQAGINILAACFGDNRKFGSCRVCVVEIAKKHSYACRKMPKKGMDIIVDREDLNALRKERLETYREKVKQKNNTKWKN